MKFAAVALAVAAFTGNLWLGTDESRAAYLDALEQVRQLEAAGPDALKAAIQLRGGGRGEDPFGLPPMWETQGDTAVVHIQGSLVNGSSGFYRLFGILGYEDIKGAVSDALADKNVKRILLNIDSGGGAVNGVEDAGNFIRKASAIKPVISFTGGTMGSAAYWLGVSADKVFAANTAQVGSVGTLLVSMDMTEALAKDGRKATIFRHGEFKALGHPFEKLTEDAKTQLQGLVDESGKIFVEYAAERRGVTPEKFQKTMGEGRVFMGRKALDVGLIDGVMSFEELVANAKSLDKPNHTPQNSRHSAQDHTMKIRAISKAVTLAILGGTKVEALGLSTEAANVTGEKPEAEDVTALTAEANEIAAAFSAATAKAAADATATVKAESDKALAALTSKVTLLEAGAADLTGKVTASSELAAGYAGIVKASIATMCVALGATDNSAALQGKELLAEHEKIGTQFKAKFPTGGVAAVVLPTKTPEQNNEASGPSAEFLAAVAGFAKR